MNTYDIEDSLVGNWDCQIEADSALEAVEAACVRVRLSPEVWYGDPSVTDEEAGRGDCVLTVTAVGHGESATRTVSYRVGEAAPKIEHGFNLRKIRALLNSEEWGEDEEGNQLRTVWLGTVYGLTPSGKMYTPFACGNLDVCSCCQNDECDECSECGGLGSKEAYQDVLWNAAAEEAIDSIPSVDGHVCLSWEGEDAFAIEYKHEG